MSRRRAAAILVVGLVLGFFAALAAFDVRPTVPREDVTAAAPSIDALATAGYGRVQAQHHLALVRTAPIVPFIRTLQIGSRDDAGEGHGAVYYLQRALIKAGVRPKNAKSTGQLGTIAARQLRVFQTRTKIKPVTGVYGPKTHHQLAPYYDLTARRALQGIAHTRAQLGKYARIVKATSWAWKHRTSMAYSQSISRGFLPSLPGFPRATDCSGYVTWAFKVALLPDPNGFGYSPVGYTGTLAQHGTRINASGALKVGDLIFYGGGYPYGHVAIVVDAIRRLVSSHGSPGIKVVPFNYRPVSAGRRYFRIRRRRRMALA